MTRHFWLLVHRYAGLYMAFFLIVAGITGCAMPFLPEIDRWLNPQHDAPAYIRPVGQRLDDLVLREHALSIIPHANINFVSFEHTPTDAFTAFLEPKDDASTHRPYVLPANLLTLNPYTGAEIARETASDGSVWPITRENFVYLLLALHYRLAIPGNVGVWLFGIAALVWTVDCFVALYLTFPLRVKREHARAAAPTVAARPTRSWWSRWSPAWRVKWPASTVRVHFDLHRAGGLWTWLVMLTFAWSSVALNLPDDVYNPIMATLTGSTGDPLTELPTLPKARATPLLDWYSARRIGAAHMQAQARVHDFRVLREGWMSYQPEHGVFLYGVSSTLDLSSKRPDTWVAFRDGDGAFTKLSAPSGLNAGNTFTNWIVALHMTLVWGLPFRIFVAVMGFATAVLAWTGVYLWWKKRAARTWLRT